MKIIGTICALVAFAQSAELHKHHNKHHLAQQAHGDRRPDHKHHLAQQAHGDRSFGHKLHLAQQAHGDRRPDHKHHLAQAFSHAQDYYDYDHFAVDITREEVDAEIASWSLHDFEEVASAWEWDRDLTDYTWGMTSWEEFFGSCFDGQEYIC